MTSLQNKYTIIVIAFFLAYVAACVYVREQFDKYLFILISVEWDS